MDKQARTRKQEMAAVAIETPAVLMARPQEYAQRQRERVVMEPLAQKAERLSGKVERQELQIAEQVEREKLNNAILAYLRHVDLGVVLTALGGEPDRDH